MPPPKPSKPRDTAAAREARLAREAAALRENLRRRKEQARARHDDGAPDVGPPAAPEPPQT